MPSQQTDAGFTLIETLLTVALVTALFAVSAFSLGRPQTTGSLNGVTDMLVADLKSQQLLAMTGNQGSSTGAQPHGVYIQPNGYTLFAGTDYDSQDPNNYTVAPEQTIAVTTTFADNTIYFVTGSGEVQDFTIGDNTITLQTNGESRTISLNRFGMIEVE